MADCLDGVLTFRLVPLHLSRMEAPTDTAAHPDAADTATVATNVSIVSPTSEISSEQDAEAPVPPSEEITQEIPSPVLDPLSATAKKPSEPHQSATPPLHEPPAAAHSPVSAPPMDLPSLQPAIIEGEQTIENEIDPPSPTSVQAQTQISEQAFPATEFDSVEQQASEFFEQSADPSLQPSASHTPEISNILPPDNSFLPTSYLHDENVSYIPNNDEEEYEFDHNPQLQPPPPQQAVETLSPQDLKESLNLIKVIKRHPSAWPFLTPVDPVAAGAPTYFQVVKSPMDFSTIEKRLSLVHYSSVEMVLADIQLVLDNCYLFNPPTNNVHTLATHIDKLLEGRIPKIWRHLRWRNTALEEGPETAMTDSEWKDCKFLIKTVKLHHSAWPFCAPVDPIALGIPTYFQVVKTPMDFGTIEKRVELGYYENVKSFIADLQLVFDNCYLFNPPDHSVSVAAKQVEKYLENQLIKLWPMVKWRGATVMNLGTGSGRAAAAVASIAFKQEANVVVLVEEPRARRPSKKGKSRRLSSDGETYGHSAPRPTKKIALRSGSSSSTPIERPVRMTSSSAKAADITASLALLQQQMSILKGEGGSSGHKKKKHKKDDSVMRTTQLLASAAAATIAGMVAKSKRKHSDEESSSSSSSSSSDSDSESESEVAKMKQLLASFNTIQAQATHTTPRPPPPPKRVVSYAPPPKSCEFCEATSTSTWRRGPSGVGTLCNRCGVKWAKNNRHFFPSSGGSSSSAPPKKSKKAKGLDFVPVSYEQKVRLSAMIEGLSEQRQASVVEMIRASIPITSEGEIELDIDAIDEVSLRRLYDHVEFCVEEDKKVETEQQKAARRVIEELQRNRGE
ncbi:UNVERIFIED_CONTAM: hypothetical protein HDU68_006439 [Siphonaria sp. JEL0065]|nr:hypothetical protein HDU68_006439 [Siphonaria sp. JEL0065]